MQFIEEHKILAFIVGIIILLVLFVATQVAYIALNGKDVPAPDIPRQTQVLGSGQKLIFAVLGDSTSIGQGTEYEKSIAVQSARYLAKTRQVELTNFGISGATIDEVRTLQVTRAATFKPDVALIAVGANDVTKFSSYSSVDENMRNIVNTLKNANPSITIILTGSPQMGSVSRFPWVVKQLARKRAGNINAVFDTIAKQKNVTRLGIAEGTGDLFLNNPGLFAQDNFHPNTDGYATWQPIINDALSKI